VVSAGVHLSCPHAGECAGCPAIDLSYEEQLRLKGERVGRALGRFPALSHLAPADVTAASPVTGYRTRSKLVVSAAKVGLYAHDGHRVVDIPACLVLSPALATVADAIRGLLQRPPTGSAGALSALVAIDLREIVNVQGETLVTATLILDAGAKVGETRLRAAIEALVEAAPVIVAVATSERGPDSARVLGGAPTVLFGPQSVAEAVAVPGGGAVEVSTSPGAFVQAHRGQADRMRSRIVHALGEAGVSVAGAWIVDAYAGAGATGLTLAHLGARVTLVERFAPALEGAVRAARAAALEVDARTGDAAVVLTKLATEGARADAVLLNPPRRGLAPVVRVAAARLSPSLLLYVSCEPDTLARDLSHFALLGYGPTRVEAFDMIPLSAEVECLAVLAPAPPLAPEVLHEDAVLLAVNKPPHEPVTPHPERGGSLLGRVASLRGFASAAPVHRLDAGTSGVCLFARTPRAVRALAAALGAADKEYRALVRGVTRPRGSVSRPLGERGRQKPAQTRYRRLAVVGGHSLLAVNISTGRTHQIRRHLASIGHPVLGDGRHGHAPSNRHMEERHGLDRPWLHLARIALDHPAGGRLELQAPVPGDLEMVLARLGAART